MTTTHNLDIELYSLDEVLELFSITSTSISDQNIKDARHKMHMMHPDKSKLSADYFRFYQKAFQIVLDMYTEQTRAKEDVYVQPQRYSAEDFYNMHNKAVAADNKENTIDLDPFVKAIAAIAPEDFAKTFNEMFEKHMINAPDSDTVETNTWFKSEELEPIAKALGNYKLNEEDINEELDRVREKGSGLAIYQGVQTLCLSTVSANFNDQQNSDAYACSDPFSALQYDDVRKVYRDQILLAVSENDIDNVRKYTSVEEYARERDSMCVEVMCEDDANEFFRLQEEQRQKIGREKQYQSVKKSEDYKNRAILAEAAFRLIGH